MTIKELREWRMKLQLEYLEKYYGSPEEPLASKWKRLHERSAKIMDLLQKVPNERPAERP